MHFPTGQYVNILLTFIILQLESYGGGSLNTTCFIHNIFCLVKENVWTTQGFVHIRLITERHAIDRKKTESWRLIDIFITRFSHEHL